MGAAEEGALLVSAGDVPQQKPEVGKRCRDVVGVAVRAFLGLLEEACEGGSVPIETARRIGNAVAGAGGPLADLYARAEQGCSTRFTMLRIESQRTDIFGRLVAEPFAHLLDDKANGIERKHLGQFFAALRMILGEDVHETMKARCAIIVAECRGPDGMTDWPAYFADPEARSILEQVLVTIARSFRRFEPRKDWFLIVMNSTPSSVSLGSSVFVQKRPEDKPQNEFSESHMCRLFNALFADMRPDTFDDSRRAAFAERWGLPPEKIFGGLFVDLQRLSQQS